MQARNADSAPKGHLDLLWGDVWNAVLQVNSAVKIEEGNECGSSCAVEHKADAAVKIVVLRCDFARVTDTTRKRKSGAFGADGVDAEPMLRALMSLPNPL